eukprot:CAMPEP_0116833438 /NCGR_PEP_ID=MMETSP0418-20121206/6437_1 /TAXON_ID=1158023 /ORGANISM="Astrosyne radiata, Strain 13vi08-1A" /LENGTH=64 /DNA_ID=CAMNT_0004462889 /DNA_START=47 /DNA_END=241 /DNA_ORIENTATION=+
MVAIVGAGHVEGMCEWLTNGNGRSPHEILQEIVKTKKVSPFGYQYLVNEVSQVPLLEEDELMDR